MAPALTGKPVLAPLIATAPTSAEKTPCPRSSTARTGVKPRKRKFDLISAIVDPNADQVLGPKGKRS